MKKLLLLSAVLLAGLNSASAQYQRRVLVEEFTNASCPPCASQNPGFNALLDLNFDKVTPVKYQTSFPGADPMNAQNAGEVSTRLNYYEVGGVPTGFLDGTSIINDCNGYDGCPACLSQTDVDDKYTITTPVKIDLSYALTADFDSIIVTASVTSDVALTGDLRFHVAVIEDAIYFNSAPGSNGEKEFFQPMRKMLPNAQGTSTGDFAAAETKNYTLAWAIPAYIYNENQLGVSAWLQNNTTKEVFQSFRAAPPSPKIFIPNANLIVCTPGFSPSVTLVNQGEEAMTSATILYRLGTGNWEQYDWTGNVAPGASTQIVLTNISITAAGNNTVNVLPVSSNNGALQTSVREGYATLTVKGLFDAGTAMPFVAAFQGTTFPPTGWNVTNAGSNGWKLTLTAGVGTPARSTKNNMYDYNNANTELLTPKIDLSTATGSTKLTFDHAYAWYDAANFDSLRIEASSDCGLTWTTIFHDGYEGLATAPATTASFTPTAAQWVNNSIDISSFNGSSNFFIRFVAESGFGNNLYLDNVNVATAVGVKNLDLTSFSITPNPTEAKSEVRFGLPTAQNIQLMVFNTLGALVQSRDLGELPSGDHSVAIEALGLNSGSYRVVLQGTEGVAQTQWIILK